MFSSFHFSVAYLGVVGAVLASTPGPFGGEKISVQIFSVNKIFMLKFENFSKCTLYT